MAIKTSKVIEKVLPKVEDAVRNVKRGQLDYKGSRRTADFIQETAIKVVKGYRDGSAPVDDPAAFNGYLITLVRNLILDDLRSAHRRRTKPAADSLPDVADSDSPEDDRLSAVTLERVHARLVEFFDGKGLGATVNAERRERMREVLRLNLEGLSNEKVAEALGVSKATVHGDLTFIRSKVVADFRRETRHAG